MKSIEEKIKSAMEGFAPPPPPRVKQRLAAGLWGGSFSGVPVLVLLGLLLALGVPAAVALLRKSVQDSRIENTNILDKGYVRPDSTDAVRTARPLDRHKPNSALTETAALQIAAPLISEIKTQQPVATQKDTRHFASGQQNTPELWSDLASKQKNLLAYNSSLLPQPIVTSAVPNTNVNERATDNTESLKDLPEKKFERLSLMTLKKAGSSLRTENTLSNPEDFFMPRAPRKHGKWSLQTQFNAGGVKSVLKNGTGSPASLLPDPANSFGYGTRVLYHARSKWNASLDIFSITSRFRTLAEFENTQVVLVNGEPTTIVSQVSENQIMRVAYLRAGLGAERVFWLAERWSLEVSGGAEVRLFGYGNGLYRISNSRLLNMSLSAQSAEVVLKRPFFLTAGAGVTYRIFHRLSLHVNIRNFLPVSKGGGKTADYLMGGGFGYRF